jgi:hypothetical protein
LTHTDSRFDTGFGLRIASVLEDLLQILQGAIAAVVLQ